MIKYNQLGISKYNQLGKIEYNSRAPSGGFQPFNRLAGAMPVIYSQNNERLAILENADEPILDQEIGGVDTLTFLLPFTDRKRKYVQNENYVVIVDRRYIIRNIKKIRTGDSLEIEVYCEATWYDLQETEPMTKWEWTNATPREMLSDMLYRTGWSVGIVEVEDQRNLTVKEGLTNRLKAIQELPKIFEGELRYNTDNNSVDFIKPIGRDSGAAIVYRKNMTSIEVEHSTEGLITKLYLYGKNNMTIEEAHPEGLPYIENYQYTSKVKVGIMKDERFTNPFHLYDRGVNAINVLSRPTGAYTLKMSDLSSMSGMRHETFFLGDSVWVFDEELEVNERKRIMRWKYNLKRPWDTEMDLESKHPTLSDLISGTTDSTNSLSSEDSVGQDEMLNLSVFNYLLNSRADDGFAYWQNNGWDIDPINGYSGNASFKATAAAGVTKELIQEIFPSHRDEYSISFRSSVQNLSLGPNGQVGIYITIKYDDGTQDEPVFIPLIQG